MAHVSSDGGFLSAPSIIQYERLDAVGISNDEAFAAIYRESFPVAEREPLYVIKNSLSSGGLAMRAASDGRTVGFATAQMLPRVPAVFLVYLAVRADARNNGLGGALLEALVAESHRTLPAGLGLVWEVDRESEATDDSERERRRRRIAFFRRHGGSQFPGKYFQPAVDGHTIVPMHLFFRPFAPGVPPPPEHFVEGIYFDKYAAVNGICPEHLDDLRHGRLPPRPSYGSRLSASL
jgi:GNAT superfamily N-acetyltransferase